MSRPRTSAAVLELHDFSGHPERRRVDPEGPAVLDPNPPEHLPAECHAAWHELVARIPRISVFNTDEIALESCARLLTEFRRTGSLKVSSELRRWLVELGFTPVARSRLATPAAKKANRFASFGRRPTC